MIKRSDRISSAVAEALVITGNGIRVARFSRGITPTQLAARMMVTTGTLRRLER
jgi:hypothetical protein